MLKLRSDYESPSCRVLEARLDIDIHADYTKVTSTLSLERLNASPFLLNGRDLELRSLRIGDAVVERTDWPLTQEGLLLEDLPDQVVVETVSICHPETNKALEGLYLSSGMYCTQCEPEGFRRICFYPDRPDVMTIFTVRIEASSFFSKLLSNGNLVETGNAGVGRHYALWHDPHPKPSYLFACVVGDLDCAHDNFITASQRHVDLHIYVEKGNIGLTRHAMESLKNSMEWDEKRFGLEYDLDLFQIVAVSHFNMGAMENKGLNIFNSKYVLADEQTATDTDLDNVESIVAHEYFHNWTGNRVTCRDWFQLTLKEGLTVYRDQLFSADMHDEGLQRANDVSVLRTSQFSEDRSPTAHPIRPESYREINNFYTATVYEKGAEVIRMLAGYLGREGFRQGMDLYFRRHDGQAVTCDDFVTALADATGTDLTAFAGWYNQAGTPRLTITRKRVDDRCLEMTLTQEMPETAAFTPRDPLPIPVRIGFLDFDGQPVALRCAGDQVAQDEHVLLIDKATQTIKFEADTKVSGLTPSLLRGFSAPVILSDDLSRDERLHLMVHDGDQFNRWDAGQTLLVDAVIGSLNGDVNVEALAEGYRQILADNRLQDDFKAGMLIIPGMSVLESHMNPADPVALHAAKQVTLQALGKALQREIEVSLSQAGRMRLACCARGRALLNQMLNLGVAAKNRLAIDCAGKQVMDQNMTLSQGALQALVDCDDETRVTALQAFHDRWQGSTLVLEKWFQMEARSAVGGTIERLATLMKHPAFDLHNPNKIRSVLGAFMLGNPTHFYAADGSGYKFVAKYLIDIDRHNPQMAARMVLPLTRMAAYDAERQFRMTAALQTISLASPSNDLGEVLDKALTTSD